MEKDFKKRMRFLGRVMYATKVISLYKDGDVYGFVWKWINPLTWVIAPIVIVMSILLRFVTSGLSGFDRKTFLSDIGFSVSPYFKQNPEKLEWMK